MGYGIELCQYVDFKSLTGDKADNIAGAEKVGTKTASTLLREFDSLVNIIQNAEKIKKQTVRESIIKNGQRLLCNQKLIKLEGKDEVPFELDKILFGYNGITTTDILRGIGLR